MAPDQPARHAGGTVPLCSLAVTSTRQALGAAASVLCWSGDSGGVRGARRSRAARRGMQTASGARTSALRRRGRMQVAVQCAGGFAAHRMDRKPDWKVFLNMAAARVSGSHTSALRPGPCRARGRASAATRKVHLQRQRLTPTTHCATGSGFRSAGARWPELFWRCTRFAKLQPVRRQVAPSSASQVHRGFSHYRRNKGCRPCAGMYAV